MLACVRACDGELTAYNSETKPISSEVLRLRRQLERSKESRKVMAEEHDEAVARLERAKEVGVLDVRRVRSYSVRSRSRRLQSPLLQLFTRTRDHRV